MPKYYCEYCGIYLTHSSPSGRKQHSHGRKHIQNKIEYYSQFLLDQGMKGGSNPFMKPGGLPIGIGLNPLALSRPTALPGGGLVVPTINIPGIMPTNITNIPISSISPGNIGQMPQMQPGMGMGMGLMPPTMMGGPGGMMPNPMSGGMMPSMMQLQQMQGGSQMMQMGQMGQMGQQMGQMGGQMGQMGQMGGQMQGGNYGQ